MKFARLIFAVLVATVCAHAQTTPEWIWHPNNGAKPDLLVPQTPEDESKDFDAQLKADTILVVTVTDGDDSLLY